VANFTNGFSARVASANNVLTETSKNDKDEERKNTYELKYDGDLLVTIIIDNQFGNAVHDKDTFNLVYKPFKK
jgi:hypothetical protein